MITAILALVGSIVGFAGSIFKGTNERYLQRQAEYEAAIKFGRDKELSIYGAYANEAQTRTLVIVGGLIAVVVLVYILNK